MRLLCIVLIGIMCQGCTGAIIYAYRKNRQEIRLARDEKRMTWWDKCEEEGDGQEAVFHREQD